MPVREDVLTDIAVSIADIPIVLRIPDAVQHARMLQHYEDFLVDEQALPAPAAVTAVATSSDGRFIAAGTTTGEVVVWVGHARFSTWVVILLCGVVAVVTAVVVFVIALRGAWPLAIVPVASARSVAFTRPRCAGPDTFVPGGICPGAASIRGTRSVAS